MPDHFFKGVGNRMNTFSEDNQERIRSLAWKLRQKHNAVNWGVSPVQIMKREGLDYSEYDLTETGIWAKLKDGVKALTKKIQAALIVKESLVLVDIDLHQAKKPFGQGHELGHHAIPEHKEILYVCSEADLDPQTRREMEFEANVFSSEFLIPTKLLNKLYQEYPLSIETILQLHDLSKASIHSSAIRYVSTCPEKCCLLFLEFDKDEDGEQGMRLTKQLWSPSWQKEYKRKIIEDGQFFSQKHFLSAAAFTGKPGDIFTNNISLRDSGKSFAAQTFYNGHIVFALLFDEAEPD
jgi:Zn-dependent peptidase ImmA (M78 family)